LAAATLQDTHPASAFAGFQDIEMRKTKVKTAALPAGWALPFIFAALAMALALLAAPRAGLAQGIVRGAQQGAYEGHRVAGPVGGVVGGAVGAGVGGAMGAVEGVLGLPEPRWHHCRGYRDGYGRFHCYRHY
jgi:hypothetical protein